MRGWKRRLVNSLWLHRPKEGRPASVRPGRSPATLGCRAQRRHRRQSRGSSLTFPGGASVCPSVLQLP